MREGDGSVHFTVTSDGKTGPEWFKHFVRRGCRVSCEANAVLHSKAFVPTKGITTAVAVLEKSMLPNTGIRWTKEAVEQVASKRLYTGPSIEMACLIREKFSNAELRQMGLRCIIVMHDPVQYFKAETGRLVITAEDVERDELSLVDDSYGFSFGPEYGFAFDASRVPVLA